MPNVFHYLALMSESPEGLRRGSEFRVEREVGFKIIRVPMFSL